MTGEGGRGDGPGDAGPVTADQAPTATTYTPPQVRVLGSLAELTLAGTTTTSDGSGYTGASGSV